MAYYIKLKHCIAFYLNYFSHFISYEFMKCSGTVL